MPDRDLATALWLMESLSRPLLLEGEAGVGKTEVARTLALAYDTKLIRLQCYEGLDQSSALYEWNYQRQLLAIKARGANGCCLGGSHTGMAEAAMLSICTSGTIA
ncbi:hypothetical protein Sa4125_05540 [Aureimonas sp. SA4125]|nr:hypothetical protein Sa4125_05540 [Aureimonas sp. SA4125]